MAKVFAFDLKVKASLATARQKNKFFWTASATNSFHFGAFREAEGFWKAQGDKGYVAYRD
jgi:hypothetical protein